MQEYPKNYTAFEGQSMLDMYFSDSSYIIKLSIFQIGFVLPSLITK